MYLGLPHQNNIEYHRDYEAGALEKYFPEKCPVCCALLDHIGDHFRKILGIPLLRARCKGPKKHHFTFIPAFVAPAKWYGYFAIEEALGFVAQQGFLNPASAFRAWEERRDERILDEQPPGPCTSSVRRWWREFGQAQNCQVWLNRCMEESARIPAVGWPGHVCGTGPDGLPGEKIAPPIPAKITSPSIPGELSQNRRSGLAEILLETIRSLGQALLGRAPSPVTFSLLGIGLWFLEIRVSRRCLARFELTGKVVPGPIPNLAVIPLIGWDYYSESYQPP